jgi:hypothetical protein
VPADVIDWIVSRPAKKQSGSTPGARAGKAQTQKTTKITETADVRRRRYVDAYKVAGAERRKRIRVNRFVRSRSASIPHPFVIDTRSRPWVEDPGCDLSYDSDAWHV